MKANSSGGTAPSFLSALHGNKFSAPHLSHFASSEQYEASGPQIQSWYYGEEKGLLPHHALNRNSSVAQSQAQSLGLLSWESMVSE